MASDKYKRRRQWSAAAIAWAIVLLVLSTLPRGKIPVPDLWWRIASPDKWVHALVYGVFAVLLFLLLRKSSRRAGWIAIGIAFLYGAAMEVLQMLMGRGRAFEVADMLANGLGAMVAVGLFCYFTKSETT